MKKIEGIETNDISFIRERNGVKLRGRIYVCPDGKSDHVHFSVCGNIEDSNKGAFTQELQGVLGVAENIAIQDILHSDGKPNPELEVVYEHICDLWVKSGEEVKGVTTADDIAKDVASELNIDIRQVLVHQERVKNTGLYEIFPRLTISLSIDGIDDYRNIVGKQEDQETIALDLAHTGMFLMDYNNLPEINGTKSHNVYRADFIAALSSIDMRFIAAVIGVGAELLFNGFKTSK